MTVCVLIWWSSPWLAPEFWAGLSSKPGRNFIVSRCFAFCLSSYWCTAPESVSRGACFVRVCGAGLAAVQPPGMFCRLVDVQPPSPWLGMFWFARVCGAGLAAAQPPGMILPSWWRAAPESVARGVLICNSPNFVMKKIRRIFPLFASLFASWHAYEKIATVKSPTLQATKMGRQTSQATQTKSKCSTCQQLNEVPNGLGSSNFTFWNQFSNSKICQLRSKYDDSNWLNSNSYFWNQAKLSEFQTKIMESFISILGVSMNNFIFLEILKCSK